MRTTIAAIAMLSVAFVFTAAPAQSSASTTAAPQGQGHHAGPPPGQVHKPAKPAGKPAGTGNGKSSAKAAGPHGAKTVQQHLQQSPQLATKLGTLLPAGTNLENAGAGFKNFGQFVAAAHVSHNLGISFDELKGLMTGDKAVSLGQAVHTLRPDTGNDAVKQAETEADNDLTQARNEANANKAKAKTKNKGM